MRATKDYSTLKETWFNLFNSLLENHSGISFDINRAYLMEQGLNMRMKSWGLSSYEGYYSLLVKDSAGNRELSRLIELLTVGETYFFRNQNLFTALTDYMIPSVMKHKNHVNILSAACATGEEPYSIIMQCREHFPFLLINVTGADINNTFLQSAKKGVYSKHSMRKISDLYLKKYFKEEKGSFFLDPGIIESVKFINGNLNDPDFYRGLPLFDIIFCRNVLIYFPLPVYKQTIMNMKSILSDRGFLILGESETLHGISDDFSTEEYNNTFFYTPKSTPSVAGQNPGKLQFRSPGVKAFQKSDSSRFADSLSNTDTLTVTKEKVCNNRDDRAKERIDIHTEYRAALQCIGEDKTEEALNRINLILAQSPDNKEAIVTSALLEAGKGNIERALQLCNRCLEIDEFYTLAFYLTGLIKEASGNAKEAKRAYEAAVFLKRNCALSHFKLGQINSRLNNHKEAVKRYKNTLSYLTAYDDLTFEIFSGGFSKDTISKICKEAIEKYGNS